jgi:Kdo2-lipid IVA lauroyltransferase/acyltransferase
MEPIDISYHQFKKKRPRWTTRIRRELEYQFFRFASFLGRNLSLEQLQWLGRGLGRLTYIVLKKDRGICEKQLEWVFPEVEETQRQQWIHECFLHFGQGLFEFFAMEQVIQNVDQRIHVENPEVLQEAFAEGKGVLLLAMHMGNWEYVVPYLVKTGYPTTAVTTNYPEPRINQTILSTRTRDNIQLIPRGDPKTVRLIFQCFKRKEIFLIAIDQDTNVPSMFVPFFGISAKTPTGPTILAMKFGTVVVSNVVLRQPDGTFRLRFERLGSFLRENYQDQDAYEVTLQFNQHMEALIRKNPEQWAWFHRRWRNRPEIEA